jgi:hypothetical protein
MDDQVESVHLEIVRADERFVRDRCLAVLDGTTDKPTERKSFIEDPFGTVSLIVPYRLSKAMSGFKAIKRVSSLLKSRLPLSLLRRQATRICLRGRSLDRCRPADICFFSRSVLSNGVFLRDRLFVARFVLDNLFGFFRRRFCGLPPQPFCLIWLFAQTVRPSYSARSPPLHQ